MARAGRGGAALATAAIGSFVAGTISTLAITFLAPLIAQAARAFQPADYFALMVLAFVSVTASLILIVVLALIFVLLNLLVDLLYAYLDPRIRYT
jgi:putative tricarboxylic transport membrane protein